MIELILPIFVIEGNDVIIFVSLEDVQTQLEPIDIRDNVYTSYDAEGRLLKLETDGSRIKVLPAEENPGHAPELESSLRQYLMAMKEPRASEKTCGLQCLVTLSLKYAYKPFSLTETITNLWRKLFRGK